MPIVNETSTAIPQSSAILIFQVVIWLEHINSKLDFMDLHACRVPKYHGLYSYRPPKHFCLLDDVLIVIKGHDEEHFSLVKDWLTKLGRDDFRKNLPKGQCGKPINSWLVYIISQSSNPSLKTKTFDFLALNPTNTLKKLCSFLGFVHYISKIIPNLAQLHHRLRPLLCNAVKDDRTKKHTSQFFVYKTHIANHTKNVYYSLDSCFGRGAVPKQLTVYEPKPLSFGSRFLTQLRSDIVWAGNNRSSLVNRVFYKLLI